MPGYQHVRRLARALVGVRNRQGLSDRRVHGLVALWLVLPDFDKQRLIYPARHQERRGSFRGGSKQRRGNRPLNAYEG